MKTKILVALYFTLPYLAFAQDGSLDLTFGLKNYPGYYFKTISSYGEYNNGYGKVVAVSKAGNIIIGSEEEKRVSYSDVLTMSVGLHDVSIDGTIVDDNSSGSGYIEKCNDAIFLSNNKPLLVGSKQRFGGSDIFIQIDNIKGQIDFGKYEGLTSVQEYNNKLYASGYLDLVGISNKLMIARFDLNGDADKTFGGKGYITPNISVSSLQVNQICIQSDSKILVLIGNKIIRFLNNGSIDETFGVNGTFLIPDLNANKILVQDDNKILIAGNYVSNYSVMRINSNGSLDTTFAKNGVYTEYSIEGRLVGIKLLSNGKIILGGTVTNGIGILRLNTNGVLDLTFGKNGISSTIVTNGIKSFNVNSMNVKPDGKILFTGSAQVNAPNNKTQIFITQFNNTIENLKTNEINNNQSIIIYPNPASNTVNLQNMNGLNYEIIDMFNRLVLKGIIVDNKINIDALIKGTYILIIKSNNEIINQKIIKE